MNKKIELRKIRDFGEVINDTFVFIAQNWKALLRSYAIICGFFILASLVVSILNQIKVTTFVNNSDAPFRVSNSPFGMFGWEYFLTIIFTMLSYLSIHLTTLAYIAVYREKGNEEPTTEEVWSYFKFYFLRVSWAAFLLTLGLCAGLVMCIVPFFYLWPIFSLVMPIIVFENTTLGYAFSRSFQLIKDNFWSTLGIVVVAAIIVYIAMMIFVLPVSLFNVGSLLAAGHHLSKTVSVITAVAQHICQTFYMLPTIAVAICYFSLTEQKDNTGLLDRISSLGAKPEQAIDNDQLPSQGY